MHCNFDPNQGLATLCSLYVDMCGLFSFSLRHQEGVRSIRMGEFNFLNCVPYRCYMYAYIIAIGSIGHVSVCSFPASQDSDLALLVGYLT